jgi:hypothetical protein
MKPCILILNKKEAKNYIPKNKTIIIRMWVHFHFKN